MSAHKGSCHCGRVRFEVDFEVSMVITCNCSICNKKGAIYAPARENQLQISQGEEELSLYQFGTNTAKHYFCKHCGIHPFLRSRLTPDSWTINVLCLDGINLQDIPSKEFDGQNWEETAHAWLKRK